MGIAYGNITSSVTRCATSGACSIVWCLVFLARPQSRLLLHNCIERMHNKNCTIGYIKHHIITFGYLSTSSKAMVGYMLPYSLLSVIYYSMSRKIV